MKRTKRLVVIAIFTALSAVFCPIPFCFMLPLIMASIWFDWITALAMGAIFGVISYLYSLMGGSPISIAFLQYPYIAILPRCLVGIATHGVYKLISKCTAKSENMFVKFTIPAGVAGMIGSLVNTAGVLGMFALCAWNAIIEDTAMTVLLASWAISGVIEAAIALILTPSVDAVGRKVLMQTSLRSGR